MFERISPWVQRISEETERGGGSLPDVLCQAVVTYPWVTSPRPTATTLVRPLTLTGVSFSGGAIAQPHLFLHINDGHLALPMSGSISYERPTLE